VAAYRSSFHLATFLALPRFSAFHAEA